MVYRSLSFPTSIYSLSNHRSDHKFKISYIIQTTHTYRYILIQQPDVYKANTTRLDTLLIETMLPSL